MVVAILPRPMSSQDTGPQHIEDLKRCPFCTEAPENVNDEHREVCLNKHCTDTKHRLARDLPRQHLVRVQTCGLKLGVMTIDIPLMRARANLEGEIWWRIRHRYSQKPNYDMWKLSATRMLTSARLRDCNGSFLDAGEVVEVMVENDSKDEDQQQNDEVYINATPDADVLGANDDYESRNNRVGYLISEFIDNSLMALMRKYEHQGWPRDGAPTIRLYMLVSADGQDVAVCIEDDANGITLPDLNRMVKLRAKVCRRSRLMHPTHCTLAHAHEAPLLCRVRSAPRSWIGSRRPSASRSPSTSTSTRRSRSTASAPRTVQFRTCSFERAVSNVRQLSGMLTMV